MHTREGVLGNEYNKWSDLVTPRHTVVLPYTRGLLGEMDFTPGGFNHVIQDRFEAVGGDAPNPTVMGTRCHQLAMTVIYESAFTVICDSPDKDRDQPGSYIWDVTLWKDGPESFENPSQLVKESMEIGTGDSISIRMERGGGFVMIFSSPVPADSSPG